MFIFNMVSRRMLWKTLNNKDMESAEYNIIYSMLDRSNQKKIENNEGSVDGEI